MQYIMNVIQDDSQIKRKERMQMERSTTYRQQKSISRELSGIMKKAAGMWQLYVLILPALVYLVVFSYFPMYGIQIAFKNYRVSMGIWDSPWVGLQHFERFLTFPDFWKIMGNTFRISFKSLIWGFPFPIVLALLLNELTNLRFKKAVQMITYAPHFISTITVCGMVLLFFNREYGVVNGIISLFGGNKIDWLSDAKFFDVLYVGSGIWQGTGWGTIIYLAALSGISPELIEAAKIDGASRLKIIWHINIPTILPTIVIMLILNCGSLLNVGFEKVFALQNDLNLSVSNVLGTYTYQIGLEGGQFSYASAIGLFNNIVNILILIFVNMVAKRLSDISIL